MLRRLPDQLVDRRQLVDSATVNLVHGRQDGAVGGRRLQLAPARGNQAGGQAAAGGMELPCPVPEAPAEAAGSRSGADCGTEELLCTDSGSAAVVSPLSVPGVGQTCHEPADQPGAF